MKSPNKKKIRPTINDKIDNFDKNAIRQKIHGFWLKNEIPTFKKIVQAVRDDTELPTIPRTSLQRILNELGFEYTKRNRNQRPDRERRYCRMATKVYSRHTTL